ncbi:MAG: nucleoside hydrolase [Aquihabitans sp.]
MRRRRIALVTGVCVAVLAAASGLSSGPDAVDAAPAVGARGPASTVAYKQGSTTTFRLAVPSGAVAGDVLVATLGFGNGGSSKPTMTPPPGWALATRTDQATVSAAVYTHVLAAGETAFTWTTATKVGGEGTLAAYYGIDPAQPVASSSGKANAAGASTATPSLSTPTPSSVVVSSFVGYRKAKKRSTWTPPTGMTELADVADTEGTHTGSTDVVVQAAAGTTGSKVAKASNSQDGSVGVLTVLRPASSPTTTTSTPTSTTAAPTTTTTTAPPTTTGPTPLIIDTDLFSDADDVGALATAFGLQVRGEAKVIAIGINTRTSRPAVAANSWKCAAAVAAFYGSSAVPIGTAMPNNGTELNTVDFVGPCAKLAPSSTSVPTTAVSVFRKALAAQPDGSVVIVEAGYAGNLAALLASPADSTSPLTGQQLVAKKVKRLAFMGGGYPSRSGENNLERDPVAAQAVASSWPTPIIWDGYEVGDEIHTGNTISKTHPSTSPVRVAYEAFVGPNNWIYSYDLVAAFNGIRPNDPSLGLVGPGTNTVTSSGGNSFRTGSGQQYYLKLLDTSALTASIEQLITTLPGSMPTNPPSTSGTVPNDTFDGNALASSAWTSSTTGSSVTAVRQQLEISHPPGSWTRGTLQSAFRFDATGRAVQVRLKRAANGGSGGSLYGETSFVLSADATHQVELFVAGGSLTAWVDNGSTSTNLTPSWPRYDATAMQWLRIRESGGTVFFEYAAGSTSPGPWTVLASTPRPFSLTSASLSLTAGSNQTTTDTAVFDDVATT